VSKKKTFVYTVDPMKFALEHTTKGEMIADLRDFCRSEFAAAFDPIGGIVFDVSLGVVGVRKWFEGNGTFLEATDATKPVMDAVFTKGFTREMQGCIDKLYANLEEEHCQDVEDEKRRMERVEILAKLTEREREILGF